MAVSVLAACGSGDFANDPRPPSPILVGVKVDAERVSISPSNFGAGVVTFAITNLSKGPIRVQLSGPASASSAPIKPGQPGSLDAQLPRGDYQMSAVGSVSPSSAKFTVAKERPSSRDRLLLP
ncbi:MAG: hypothetical protein ACRDK1_02800 [Solirubrobacterales bacterium]